LLLGVINSVVADGWDEGVAEIEGDFGIVVNGFGVEFA
jgi:hypothetical protein